MEIKFQIHLMSAESRVDGIVQILFSEIIISLVSYERDDITDTRINVFGIVNCPLLHFVVGDEIFGM